MPAWLKFALENVVIKASGLKGWVAKKAMIYGGQMLYDLVMYYWKKFERNSADKKAQEELKKVIDNPDAKIEEKGKALEDYFNKP